MKGNIKKSVYDISKDSATRELKRINAETASVVSLLNMIARSYNQESELFDKAMSKYCAVQTNGEMIRQELLSRYRPDNVHVHRFGVDIINGQLFIVYSEVEHV